MYKDKAVLEYWQRSLQQQALAALLPDQVKNKWRVISQPECAQGKLDTAELLESTSMVIAPCYAQLQDNYFIPYVLLVNIDAGGNFVARADGLPIMLKCSLEPAALCPISLGVEQNFENHFVLQPPAWLEDASLLTWQNQLAYAQQMLSVVTNDQWQADLAATGYTLQDSVLMLALDTVCQPAVMDASILKNKKKLELIDAPANSGKSAYAKRLISAAWMEAAVKQAPPPEYVWLQPNVAIKYASIFDCASGNMPEIAKSEIHKDLAAEFNIYIKGQQVLRAWQELTAQLHDKYSERGGVAARIAQLRAHMQDARIRHRHLQVLHAIWTRQLELVPRWSRVLDVVPKLQRRRLRRLYAFFKQNFPEEAVAGFTQGQLNDLLTEQMRRIENRQRFIDDTLCQTENDIRQEELVRDKCLQWASAQNLSLENVSQVAAVLNNYMWPDLVNKTLHYWQLDFATNDNYADFLQRVPDKIENLIVEHAEYISPLQAAQLLAISERAVVMGSYNAICNPRFSVFMDYELTKRFKLASCDEEFEDLQFAGILASVGNMWSLAAQGKDAQQIFTARDNHELTYNLYNINSVAENYLGSKINRAEADAIVQWLNNNSDLAADAAIYTTFSGQAAYLRQQLSAQGLLQVPVWVMPEPCLSKAARVLFSPVYTAADPGPYIFDGGVEILDNLIANATQRIIVFGDQNIFKPELHSAAGKFAKLLFKKQEEEVACV